MNGNYLNYHCVYLASPPQEAAAPVGWDWLGLGSAGPSKLWIGIRCKQLGPPRLIYIHQGRSILPFLKFIPRNLRHQHAILVPLHPPTRHLNLQLEEISSFQHTALQIVEREGRSSQAYVLEDHRLEGNLGEVKYLNAVHVQSVTQRLGATREIAMLSM